MRKLIALLILGTIAAAMLQGCGASTPAQSPDEVKGFKGGPMPPEAVKAMQDAMKSGQNAGQQAHAGNEGKGPGQATGR